MLGVRRAVRVVSGIVELAAEGGERIEAVIYRTARGRLRAASCRYALAASGRGAQCQSGDVGECRALLERHAIVLGAARGHLRLDRGAAHRGCRRRRGHCRSGSGRSARPACGHRGHSRARRQISTRQRGTRGQADAASLSSADAPFSICFISRRRLSADRAARPLCAAARKSAARQVLETAALGCPGPNQIKAFLRCGMGPCQGRFCGLTVTELMAQARGVSCAEIGYYRLRPPVKPITLAELAGLPTNEAAVKAVARE